jgi:hypothetical protein
MMILETVFSFIPRGGLAGAAGTMAGPGASLPLFSALLR